MPSTVDVAHGRVCVRCGRPVTRTDSGEWRCTPCRTDQRADELRAQRGREDHAHITRSRVADLARRAENDEDLTVDEWRTLVDGDPVGSWDFGDNWALMAALYPPPAADLAQADALWTGRAARGILRRAGVTVDAFTRQAGVGSRRTVYTWLDGRVPKSAPSRPAAAMLLLVLKHGNEESDAILVAHGLEPTLTAERRFDKTHVADDRCDGCIRAGKVLRSMRAKR